MDANFWPQLSIGNRYEKVSKNMNFKNFYPIKVRSLT